MIEIKLSDPGIRRGTAAAAHPYMTGAALADS
jgi:hypothetical protein